MNLPDNWPAVWRVQVLHPGFRHWMSVDHAAADRADLAFEQFRHWREDRAFADKPIRLVDPTGRQAALVSPEALPDDAPAEWWS